MFQQTTSQFALNAGIPVSGHLGNQLAPVSNLQAMERQVFVPPQPVASAAQSVSWIHDDELRADYMEASLEQDIAWQVRINREARGLSQVDLANLIGTHQSAISRAEDPAYGKLSIGTLTKIAHAFECALLLRFVSYEDFAHRVGALGEEALYVKPFGSKE